MKRFLLIVIAIVLAGAAGWYAGRRGHITASNSPERQVAFYQGPMHPWIKSDQPGNCTICGMKLTPVYQGDEGFSQEANLVTLTPTAISVVNVQTEAAELRPIERHLRVAGRIEAPETRSRLISAYVDGRIDRLFVNFVGAEVQEGEPLAQLYSPALLTAEREYLTALSQTNLAGMQFGPAQQRIVEGARTRLKRLGLTDEQIDAIPAHGATNLNTKVVAPMSGTVVARGVVEGQYVKEGDKLFEIADLSRTWFQFEVYEQDLPFIRPGQTVTVTSPALGDKVFEGPITFIDPTINPATRSARVRVELENPLFQSNGQSSRLLYNGIFADGTVQVRSEPVLAVSRSAVIDPGDLPRVYVDRGAGAYEHRAVVLGQRGEGYIEVLQGISAGERVVVNGGLLQDSQAQIHQAGSSSPAEATPTEHPDLELSQEQAGAVQQMVESASALATVLASDDRDGFNRTIADLPEPAAKLREAFKGEAHLAELAAAVVRTAELTPAENLVLARTRFLPFSMALSEFTQALRHHGGDVAAKVYRCPMYPEMGKTAYWVQAEGPLRNPFFGAEMLECGVEVQ